MQNGQKVKPQKIDQFVIDILIKQEGLIVQVRQKFHGAILI